MDRGAWQVTVHGVTKSRTRLSICVQPKNKQTNKQTKKTMFPREVYKNCTLRPHLSFLSVVLCSTSDHLHIYI